MGSWVRTGELVPIQFKGLLPTPSSPAPLHTSSLILHFPSPPTPSPIPLLPPSLVLLPPCRSSFLPPPTPLPYWHLHRRWCYAHGRRRVLCHRDVWLHRKGCGTWWHGMFPLHEELWRWPRTPAPAESQGPTECDQPQLWDTCILQALAGQVRPASIYQCCVYVSQGWDLLGFAVYWSSVVITISMGRCCEDQLDHQWSSPA